jgi:hypothetical protein
VEVDWFVGKRQRREREKMMMVKHNAQTVFLALTFGLGGGGADAQEIRGAFGLVFGEVLEPPAGSFYIKNMDGTPATGTSFP